MTLGAFRNMLAGYMGRDPGTFVVHNINLLDRAINQARKWAERQHRFECARESATISQFSLRSGGLLSSAVSAQYPGRRVAIRTIERAYMNNQELQVWSRDADIRDLGRRAYLPTTTGEAQLLASTCPLRLVRWNDRLYLSPTPANETTGTVNMDVVAWLPDYVKDDDSDFFLDHCEDFMLLRAAFQLNFMLKEDQRVNITGAALAQVWETVLKVDNDAVTGSSDDNTLD